MLPPVRCFVAYLQPPTLAHRAQSRLLSHPARWRIDAVTTILPPHDRCSGIVQLHINITQLLLDALNQPLQTAGEREEDGSIARIGRGTLLSQTRDQAAVLLCSRYQVRDNSSQAQPVGSSRMNAAQQRLNQSLDRLTAET